MAGPVTVAVTETQQIEEALHALVTLAVSDIGYAGNRLAPEGPRMIGDLLQEFLSSTEARRDASELISRPVGEAVRRGITALGLRLHEIGGPTLMQDTAERVADRDPSNYSRRVDVMDKRFDGIGGWAA